MYTNSLMDHISNIFFLNARVLRLKTSLCKKGIQYNVNWLDLSCKNLDILSLFCVCMFFFNLA